MAGPSFAARDSHGMCQVKPPPYQSLGETPPRASGGLPGRARAAGEAAAAALFPDRSKSGDDRWVDRARHWPLAVLLSLAVAQTACTTAATPPAVPRRPPEP